MDPHADGGREVLAVDLKGDGVVRQGFLEGDDAGQGVIGELEGGHVAVADVLDHVPLVLLDQGHQPDAVGVAQLRLIGAEPDAPLQPAVIREDSSTSVKT